MAQKKLIRGNRLAKHLIIWAVLLFLLFFFGSRSLSNYLLRQPRLEIVFCDVGQGDGALIKAPQGQIIVIDGGPDGAILKCLGDNLPFWRRQIDFIILSHYHDDHVFGLPEIARRYQIKNFIYAPDEYYSAPREVLKVYLTKQRSRIIELLDYASLNLDEDCYFELLNPIRWSVPPDGNNSIIAKLSCRGKRFLFSGDNEAKVEKALLAGSFDFTADVFKASHHGSKTSNTEEFLKAGGFKSLIISVGANKFGHPSPEVLEITEQLGLDIKRTDQSGTIKFIVK